jgi:phosphate transport system substrate-binding protein
VRAVPLAERPDGSYYSGTYEEVTSGKYPLSRFLFVYVNKAPGRPPDPLVHEFLKLVYSKEGQEVVVKDGYLPLTAAIVAEETKKLQ